VFVSVGVGGCAHSLLNGWAVSHAPDLPPAMCVCVQAVPLEEIARQILEKGTPIARATQAEAVRLHDDKVGA
jgi:hypothetical protein